MDETESRNGVHENGILLVVPPEKRRTELLKFYNAKLSLFREAVLASLKVEAEASGKVLLCLEADAGSGVAALQWKKQLGERVQVVVAEKKPTKIEFESMCKENGLEFSPWTLDPDRVPGEWSKLDHGRDIIHASPFSAIITLHHEAFNFVYIQLNNSITSCVDAVFANIRHSGVACFVSPNIASQCFRCPPLIHRLYQAHVLKTEYVKEMAARLVIGDIVRAASRHCRGVEVLYTMCFEDHILIAVRVVKKNQTAMACAEQIRPILHCLMCEERVVYPDVHSPVELPYCLLPCDCKDRHPGKTAVIIGPMWTGNIFNVSYLQKILAETKILHTSKTSSLLESMLTEAICTSLDSEEKLASSCTKVDSEEKLTTASKKPDSEEKLTTASITPDSEEKLTTASKKPDSEEKLTTASTKHDSEGKLTTASTKPDSEEKLTTASITPDSEEKLTTASTIVCCEENLTTASTKVVREDTSRSEETIEPAQKRRKIEADKNVLKPESIENDELENNKPEIKTDSGIKADDMLKNRLEKKMKSEELGDGKQSNPMPLFYRNLHKQKNSGLPKLDKFVKFLKREGFRASRTHFEEHSIRTNATGKQLEKAIATFLSPLRAGNGHPGSLQRV